MSKVEQPEYAVESRDGAIEVRRYAPMIAAEVAVKGERESAISGGFRLIAAYIFGQNAPSEKIAMTAPVQQQKAGVKIAMTAPVQQQGAGDLWNVRFIMPKSFTMETLPQPSDTRVKLVPMPARRFVVLQFAGSTGDAALAEKTKQLAAHVSEKGLRTTGEPMFAFYNPPWTLPMLRRNEVMLELAE